FQAIDEPPYLTVGTDVSAKYRGAFCEAKIKTAKRLVKVKVCDFPVNVGFFGGCTSKVGVFSCAALDTFSTTLMFDDGDEKTLRRSSLCLKGERHFAESEVTEQL
uniref:Tudor domain-containing protein n=1 Tax=Pavo cristatus TaxID=9049 RepID=A0A8C9G753_PAVCR